MIALVLTQGPPTSRRALRRLAARAGLILAADGGAGVAHAAGIVPQLIVGDLDSLDRVTRRWAAARGIPRRPFPREKNATDAALALHEAVRRGAGEVWIYTAVAGRLDQILANVLLLFEAERLKVRARLTDGTSEAWLAGRSARITGRPGDVVSLIPLTPAVRGITTIGLRYRLRGSVLRRGSTRGVSNELTGVRASVRVAAGDLLIVHLSAQRS